MEALSIHIMISLYFSETTEEEYSRAKTRFREVQVVETTKLSYPFGHFYRIRRTHSQSHLNTLERVLNEGSDGFALWIWTWASLLTIPEVIWYPHIHGVDDVAIHREIYGCPMFLWTFANNPLEYLNENPLKQWKMIGNTKQRPINHLFTEFAPALSWGIKRFLSSMNRFGNAVKIEWKYIIFVRWRTETLQENER